MGGIIEDKIFEVLQGERMTCGQIYEGCKRKTEGPVGAAYERTMGVISKHLRKMATVRQLGRERVGNSYVYFNPMGVEQR